MELMRPKALNYSFNTLDFALAFSRFSFSNIMEKNNLLLLNFLHKRVYARGHEKLILKQMRARQLETNSIISFIQESINHNFKIQQNWPRK